MIFFVNLCFERDFIMYGSCNCSKDLNLYEFVESNETGLKSSKSFVENFKQPASYKDLVDIELREVNSFVSPSIFLECDFESKNNRDADIKWEIANINYSFNRIRGDSKGSFLVNKKHDLNISDLEHSYSSFYRCYLNGKLKRLILIRLTNSSLETILKYVRFFGCFSIIFVMSLLNILVWAKHKYGN